MASNPTDGFTLTTHDRRMLSADYRWSQFVSGAMRREIGVHITKDLHAQIVSCPCHYCMHPPTPTHRTGVDRVDSSGAYTPSNCVPCCCICNFMKGTMTYDAFIAQILGIAAVLRSAQAACHGHAGAIHIYHHY